MRAFTRAAASAATALALLLTGCSGGGGERTDADGTIHLRFQSLAWQTESVTANKELVAEWNAAHPGVQVEYVQGSWDSVHDQLLTSFEGDEAPDIIHDASDDLADFAYGGYLADLRTLLPGQADRGHPPGVLVDHHLRRRRLRRPVPPGTQGPHRQHEDPEGLGRPHPHRRPAVELGGVPPHHR